MRIRVRCTEVNVTPSDTSGLWLEAEVADVSELEAQLAAPSDERVEKLEAENERLRWAARGGNAINDTANLLTFMAERFVYEYGENEAFAWVRAAYERAQMLRSALEVKP